MSLSKKKTINMPLTEALQRVLQSFNVKQALPTRHLSMRMCIQTAVIDQLEELRTTFGHKIHRSGTHNYELN